MKLPLRLFCPAEDSTWSEELKTEREVQICKDIASRLSLPIRIDEEHGKLFLGRGKDWKPEPDGPKVLSVNLKDRVTILAQTNAVSCGQTSCAMAANTITGQRLTDQSWDRRHGMSLLGGLQLECKDHGVTWEDVGRPRPEIWPRVLQSLASGFPAVCGVNGPDFSPSGHGHIVCIIGVTSKTVIFADPNRGRLRELERERFEQAQEYPQGNFIFLATR